MDKSKILIVEDNIITAKHISGTLKKFGYSVTGMVNNADAVFKSIIKDTPDLVILDINLEQKVDGIQIAEKLEMEYGIGFIFLTSYNDEETINRILKINPLGYVIKPFVPADLNSVIELALFKLRSGKDQEPIKLTSQSGSDETADLEDYLFVKNGRNIDKVPISEIQFVQSDGRYTYLHYNGKKKISNTPLKILREKLPGVYFVQTHKSYIVNLTMVDTITLNYLLIGDFEIPISKNYRGGLIEMLDIV